MTLVSCPEALCGYCLFLCLKDCILLSFFLFLTEIQFHLWSDIILYVNFYLPLLPNQKPLLTYLTFSFFFFDARTWHVWVPTCTFLCAELEGCAVKLVTWSYSLFVADKSREWRDYWILQENAKVGNVTSLSILVPRTYLSSRIFNYIGYTFLCGRFS